MKTCIKCGGFEFCASGKCKGCKKSANAEWYKANIGKKKAYDAAYSKANPAKVKASKAAWFLANADKSKARLAAWRSENTERVKAAGAAWHAANPDARRVHEQNRNTKKRLNVGALSVGISGNLFKLQKGKCPCCTQPLGADYHLDHKMPLALGGSNTDDNMQLLRKTCNLQKHAKHPVDFMQSRGFLL